MVAGIGLALLIVASGVVAQLARRTPAKKKESASLDLSTKHLPTQNIRADGDGFETLLDSVVDVETLSRVRFDELTIEELFCLIDRDENGTLNRSEVIAAASLLNLTSMEASALFDKFDVDNTGILSKDAFSVEISNSTYMEFIRRGSFIPNRFSTTGEAGNMKNQKMTAEQLFMLLDTDGNGKLDRDEVIAGAGNLKMTLEEASELFDSLDVDDDGVLTKSEFTGGMESFYQSFLPDMSVMVKRASSFKDTSLVSLIPPKALRAGDMSIGFSLSPSSDKKTSSGAGKVPKRGAKKRPASGAAGKKRPAEIGTTI